MSRSGYSEDIADVLAAGRWSARVNNAIRSRRGRAFLTELAAAMDAMPVKELIADELIDDEGSCCAIGVVCKARGVSVNGVNVEDSAQVASLVDIAEPLAAEIEFQNDEVVCYWDRNETPAERWCRMRRWVIVQLARKPLAKTTPAAAG